MMGSEQYCLKWNNHWTNLVGVFNSLRVSETFVDVTLACEGQQLKAHRLVLSACSPYFKNLLVSHPDAHPIIILKGVKFHELQTLIQFIYNGEVSVKREDLASLICTAKELMIKGLDNDSLSKCIENRSKFLNNFPLNKENNYKPPILFSSLSLNKVSPTLNGDYNDKNPDTGSSDSPEDLSKSSSSPRNSPLTENENSTGEKLTGRTLSPSTSPKSPSSSEPRSKRRKRSVDGVVISTEFSPSVRTRRSHNEKSRNSGTTSVDLLNPVLTESTEPYPNVSNKEHSEGEESNPLEVDIENGAEPNRNGEDSSRFGDDSSVKNEIDIEDDSMSSMQNPEVIIKEESGVFATNGTSPFRSGISPFRSESSTPTPNTAPLKEISNISTSQQISLLQQAFSMGYSRPPIPFIPSSVADPGTTSPGLAQAKNILSFVDLLKYMNAAPSESGTVPTTSGSNRLSILPTDAGFSGSSIKPDPDRNPLTCHICARNMPTLHHMEEHVRLHEEDKPYKCEQCGQRYKYQSAFQRHQEQNHTAKLPGDKPFRCDVCGQCFKYHKSFMKHRSNHELLDTFMKPEAEDNKNAIRAFQQTMNLHRLLNPGSFTPPGNALPPDTIKEEPDVKSEPNSDEFKSKSPCLVSSTSLPGFSNSENGDEIDIKDEEEDIEVEDVPDIPDEEEAEEEKQSGKFYFCVQCKLTFRDSKSFDGHCRLSPSCSLETLKEVNVGEDISVLSVPSSSSDTPSTAASTSSNAVFSSPPSMLYTFVGGLGTIPQAGVSPTILNLSKLANLSGVNISNSGVNISSSGVRTGMTGDSIPITFSNISNSNNVVPADDVERPFKCPYCHKGFKGRENLKLHIRTHTGEKPYNCGVCGKAFGGRSDMNRHLRIHTGEKPYPCKVCGKKFARADYLSKHITTHLGIPFAKPVHSLQQSLQNLENMQNLQNLESMQNLAASNNLQATAVNLGNLSSVAPVLSNIPTLQNIQSLTQLSVLAQTHQAQSNSAEDDS